MSKKQLGSTGSRSSFGSEGTCSSREARGRERAGATTLKTRRSLLHRAFSLFLAAAVVASLLPLSSIGMPASSSVQPYAEETAQQDENAGVPGQDPSSAEDTPPGDSALSLPTGPAKQLPDTLASDTQAPGESQDGLQAAPAPGDLEAEAADPNAESPDATDENALSPLAIGSTVIVSSGLWQDFWDAWNDVSVSEIQVTQSITRTSTGGNYNSGNRLPLLTRDLKVTGIGSGVGIDFGTDSNASNSFNLGTCTAAQPTGFQLEGLMLSHAGTSAIVNSGNASVANTAGWELAITDVSGVGTPVSALVSVAGAQVLCAGSVFWPSNNDATKLSAHSLTLAPAAELSLSKSTGGADLVSLVSSLQLGDGASLSLSGGTNAVALSQNTQCSATFGSNSELSITNASNGIMMPIAPANNAANYSSFTFGPASCATIAVASTALRGTAAEFQAGSVAMITATNSSNLATTLINLKGTSATVPCYFNVLDGARVSLNAQGGNCLDVGGNTNVVSAYVRVTNGAHLQATGYGTGGNDANGVIIAEAASGGFMVTGGGILEAHSANTSRGYSTFVEQIPGGLFLVDGEDSKLLMSQRSSYSGHTATIRFRSVGNQSFDVRNGGIVEVHKYPYTSNAGDRSAAIRFGTGAGNAFVITDGGHVNVYNGGNGSLDTATDTSGGNEAIEYAADNFSFTLSGSGPSGPSSCELVADCGPAIDAGNRGGGAINIGQGTVFIAAGTTGNASFPIVNATGSGFDFTMDNPLYYDFVNRRAGGGSIFNIAEGAGWSATNSDVAVWIAGMNAWNGNPEKSYTLIDFVLQKGARTNWNWVSGDGDFETWWNASADNRMNNYTRVSANNASPVITAVEPATNADRYVRWTGVVPEGLNFDGRAFWEDEVYGIVHVVKANGTEFDAAVALTESFFSESLYTVEADAKTLDGVLRFEKAGSEAGNSELYLEAGDAYTISSYWRGNPDPSSPKRHVATDFSNAGPVLVVDVMPPLPAATVPGGLPVNQRVISGTWVEAAGDNPPVEVAAQIKQGTSDFTALPGTGVVRADGTWTFTIEKSYALEVGDDIAVVFTDANSNTEPLVDTPVRDRMVPAAASFTVTEAQHDLVGNNRIIGLDDARQIGTPEQLLDLIEARGYLLMPAKTDIPIELTATDFKYGDAATASDYSVTVRITGVELEKTYYVHVDPQRVVVGRDYFLSYHDISSRKNFSYAAGVTDTELMVEANVVAYEIVSWNGSGSNSGGLVTAAATARYVSRHFTLDALADDYFVAEVAEDTSVSARIDVNLSDVPPALVATSPIVLPVGDPGYSASLAYHKAGMSATDDVDTEAYLLDDARFVIHSGSVDRDVPGVYPVVYGTTDSDGNYVTGNTRYFAVYDADVENHSSEYLLTASHVSMSVAEAASFLAGVPTGSAYVSRASAQALVIDGSSGAATAQWQMGTLSPLEGIYPVAFSVKEDPSVTVTVNFVVYAGDAEDHSEKYLLTASEVHMNVAEAQAFIATGSDYIKKARAHVLALDNSAQSATVEFVSVTPAFSSVEDVYRVTFSVTEDPALTVTVSFTVADGYRISASPVFMTTSEATAFLATSPEGADYSTRAGAKATAVGGGVAAAQYRSGALQATEGVYPISFEVTEDPTISTTVAFVVMEGDVVAGSVDYA
ncbi:MAG: hypothetical protein LBL23_03545, partial [Coriobacteriales bacterium]|nr:hypothetical protein [Coriobacteriales bacterium]